ncbi:MAG: hypothetical protein ACXVI5_08530, partial [Halobacteriota archaeon]
PLLKIKLDLRKRICISSRLLLFNCASSLAESIESLYRSAIASLGLARLHCTSCEGAKSFHRAASVAKLPAIIVNIDVGVARKTTYLRGLNSEQVATSIR